MSGWVFTDFTDFTYRADVAAEVIMVQLTMAKPADNAVVVADNTAAKQHVIGRPFAPGQSGNPHGRPRGARSKLSEDFLRDLHEAWKKHGRVALTACATTDPSAFVKVVAGLLPRETSLDVDISIHRATSALEAFRMLKQLPAGELRELQAADADE
jgi:hypothetical protein